MSTPSSSSSVGASTHAVAGMLRSRCGVGGRSTVCTSVVSIGRSSAVAIAPSSRATVLSFRSAPLSRRERICTIATGTRKFLRDSGSWRHCAAVSGPASRGSRSPLVRPPIRIRVPEARDNTGVPSHMSSFAELGVPADLISTLRARGINEPFAIQTLTIADGVAGLDLCGRAPTGSGKTLAFGIPLVARLGRANPRRPRGLVLVPTRELAAQVCSELEWLSRPRKLRVAAVLRWRRLRSPAEEPAPRRRHRRRLPRSSHRPHRAR